MSAIDPNDPLHVFLETLTPEQKVRMFGSPKAVVDPMDAVADGIEAWGRHTFPGPTEAELPSDPRHSVDEK